MYNNNMNIYSFNLFLRKNLSSIHWKMLDHIGSITGIISDPLLNEPFGMSVF